MMAFLTTYDLYEPVGHQASVRSILRLYFQVLLFSLREEAYWKSTKKPKVPHKDTYPSEGDGLVLRELTCWPCSLSLVHSLPPPTTPTPTVFGMTESPWIQPKRQKLNIASQASYIKYGLHLGSKVRLTPSRATDLF